MEVVKKTKVYGARHNEPQNGEQRAQRIRSSVREWIEYSRQASRSRRRTMVLLAYRAQIPIINN